MSWTPQLDGLGKARLKGYHSILQSSITDLQTAIASDSTLAFITTNYPALTTAQVIRGDYERMWPITTGGYLRVYVSAGGHREGQDLTSQNFYIDGTTPGGIRRGYSTLITCVFHKDVFNIANADQQATIREDAYQTVMDWLDFDCLNTNAARKFYINSNCLNFQGGQDAISDSKIVQASKCFLLIGPGETTTVTGIQATVTGYAG